MEKDFYTDDFEQLLKDTTEDFRMYPSRKVWHSLYNDLHPAKKWPSFAVCLLLITAILYVGIHNNNTINADANNLLLANLSPTENPEKQIQTPAFVKGNKKTATQLAPGLKNDGFVANSTPALFTVPPTGSAVSINIFPPITISAAAAPNDGLATIPDLTAISSSNDFSGKVVIHTTAVEPETDYSPAIELATSSKDNSTNSVTKPEITDGATEVIAPLDNPVSPGLTPLANTGLQSVKNLNAADKEWIEDFAFHKQRSGNRFKTKFSTLVYITPSVGFRSLNKNNNLEPVNALLVQSNATSVDADDAITQQAALNLEAGATGILDISRNLRIKAGVQFNYTNYISFAERLSHPTQTNILLNDLATGNTMLVPFSSSYGNTGTDNAVRLNNKTAQFSLPIGADYKILGTDKFKWYVGASIQPTYVAGGNAYLVSSDYKNYVDVPSMLRTWNLNAGFETFISYKTKSGSVINMGPQFRYQMLSTFSNRYTYSEKLYNVGIKIGITRKF